MSNRIKSVEETYTKKTLHEQILSSPDSYIGSTINDEFEMWVIENQKMIFKQISYPPGLYKIYDEIIVNARDQSIRESTCNIIRVDISENKIVVWNNGFGIPIA